MTADSSGDGQPPAPDRGRSAAVIATKALTRRFGPSITALDDLTMAVGTGITGLVGANGAGKSTLLKAISGVPELLMNVSGEVMFDGHRIDRLSAPRIARRGLVQVPEGRRVFPESTVEENLVLGAHRRRDRSAVAGDLDAVYERFPVLRERRAHAAGLLSGGEQQMLAIGRALMSKPRLLLIDEASLGLSPKLTQTVFEVVDQINDDGTTVVIVEQNVGVLPYADQALVMQKGTITYDGRGEDLERSGDLRAAYLG